MIVYQLSMAFIYVEWEEQLINWGLLIVGISVIMQSLKEWAYNLTTPYPPIWLIK